MGLNAATSKRASLGLNRKANLNFRKRRRPLLKGMYIVDPQLVDETFSCLKIQAAQMFNVKLLRIQKYFSYLCKQTLAWVFDSENAFDVRVK
jgi:hypothetical protein